MKEGEEGGGEGGRGRREGQTFLIARSLKSLEDSPCKKKEKKKKKKKNVNCCVEQYKTLEGNSSPFHAQ